MAQTGDADEWFYAQDGRSIGPMSAARMRDLLMFDTLKPDTPVWTQAFGNEWRRLRETSLAVIAPAAAATMAPPAQGAPPSDVYAWALVALAPVGALIDAALAHGAGVELDARLMGFIYGGIYLCLAFADAALVKQSGRNVRGINLRSWAILFLPAYLIRRARALDQSFTLFFVCLGAVVLSFAITFASIISMGPMYWGVGLPPCNSAASKGQATAIFEKLYAANGTPFAVRAFDLYDVTEVSSTDRLMTCRASIIGSDGRRYDVSFTHEPSDGKVLTRLRVDRKE